MFKKLTALVLVMGMVLSLFAGCQQGVPGSDANETEKVYLGKYKVSDSFDDKGFTVILTEEATKHIDEYDVDDFPEVKLKSVKRKKLVDGEGNILKLYDRLYLMLKKPGKRNVLEAMEKIAKRPDVRKVEVDGFLSIFR